MTAERENQERAGQQSRPKRKVTKRTLSDQVDMAQAKALKVTRVLASITQGRASFPLKNVRALEVVTATKGAGAAGAR